MNIIIAGAGEVGTHLAKMLSNEDHDITVLDSEDENLRILGSSLDLATVTGSASSVISLNDANVKKADLFIGVTPFEQTNITAAILAKKLGAKKTIARIDNQEYLDAKNIEQFNELGIDYLIYPENIAAKEIIELLHQTGSSETVEFCSGKLSLYVIRIEDNAPIIGKSLRETAVINKGLDFRAVAIKRNGTTIIPRGIDRFMAKDVVYAISSQASVDSLMKSAGKENFTAKNVMILGGSRIGQWTAEGLGGHHNIKLIEFKREKCYYLSNQLKNTLVIHGDGRDMDLLNEEKIDKMDAFVAVTGSSETNILACLHAKRIGVKKTIAEVENFNYIDLAESLGIDAIVNKKISTASRIFRFTAASSQIKSIKMLRGTDAEVMEFVVNPSTQICSETLSKLKLPEESILGGVVRGDQVIIPTGETLIEAGDRVVAFAMPSAIKELSRFFD